MNRKSLIIGGFVLLMAVGTYTYFSSGLFKRQVAVYTGYSEICIDKVKYIQFISGASVKYNTDGSIQQCN